MWPQDLFQIGKGLIVEIFENVPFVGGDLFISSFNAKAVSNLGTYASDLLEFENSWREIGIDFVWMGNDKLLDYVDGAVSMNVIPFAIWDLAQSNIECLSNTPRPKSVKLVRAPGLQMVLHDVRSFAGTLFQSCMKCLYEMLVCRMMWGCGIGGYVVILGYIMLGKDILCMVVMSVSSLSALYIVRSCWGMLAREMSQHMRVERLRTFTNRDNKWFLGDIDT